MKPISSAITPLKIGEHSSTGTPDSGHGLARPDSGSVSVQPDRLLERTPADNLAEAVSSLQDCGLSVKHEVTGSRFQTRFKGDLETTTWEPVMTLTVTPSESLEADKAERIIDALGAPAPVSKLTEWLTMCAVLTAAPRDDDMTSELRLKVFTQKLADFPGDVARKVLADWSSQSKWFPVWAELEAAMNREMGIRPRLIEQARRCIYAKRY